MKVIAGYLPYDELKKRSETLREAIRQRALDALVKAGLSRDIAFLQAHNAMCSFAQGKPWEGINYGLVRYGRHLERKLSRPWQLVDSLFQRDRVYFEYNDPGQPAMYMLKSSKRISPEPEPAPVAA